MNPKPVNPEHIGSILPRVIADAASRIPRPLTDRQREVLCVIESSIRERRYPPSMREIGDAIGSVSTNNVAGHLYALERKGYIKREMARSRCITVLRSAYEPEPLAGLSEEQVSIRAKETLVDAIVTCIAYGYDPRAETLGSWLRRTLDSSASTEARR